MNFRFASLKHKNVLLLLILFTLLCIVHIICYWFFKINVAYFIYSLITEFLEKIILIVVFSLCKFFDLLSRFNPLPKFLSDVAAFQGIVVAIVIPLSFQMISRISDRYQSGVITARFKREWLMRLMPVCLLANILLAVTLRFLVNDYPTSAGWTVFAWIVYGVFFITIILLYLFFKLLLKYITDSEFIVNQLLDEAEELFK
ncbi:MAG: hypothetical protein ACTSQE_15895 [Candidatus Heimdallarchaeaceae archaeon]